jgi:hypothetical protein
MKKIISFEKIFNGNKIYRNTYLDRVLVRRLWLLGLQNASSGLLIPEKGAHWFFWGINISLLPGLLLGLLILSRGLAFSCNLKYEKLLFSCFPFFLK